jgi:hypothetical protein
MVQKTLKSTKKYLQHPDRALKLARKKSSKWEEVKGC